MRRERYKNSKQQQTNISISWEKVSDWDILRTNTRNKDFKVAVYDCDIFDGNVFIIEPNLGT